MAAESSIFVTDAEVEALLSVCRVLVAVSARSDTAQPKVFDPAQFRFLVVLAAGDMSSLQELAQATGLNMAAATRVCDRMVLAGLVGRDDTHPPQRHRLTERGRDLLRAGVGRRREALEVILERLPPPRRLEILTVLREFAARNDAADGDRVPTR